MKNKQKKEELTRTLDVGDEKKIVGHLKSLFYFTSAAIVGNQSTCLRIHLASIIPGRVPLDLFLKNPPTLYIYI